MRAVVTTDSSVALGERDLPKVGPHDAVVRTTSAGINAADLLQAQGFYPAPPGWPTDILGLECGGFVAAVGSAVSPGLVGQRVAAIVGGGGQAEFVRVPAAHLLTLPDLIDDRVSGALAETFTTAYDALHLQAVVATGDHVVISGAAGGVGNAAIQLARRAGATVTAVTRDESTHDFLRDLGAHHLTTIAHYDLPARADVIIELVGAAHLELAQRHFAPRARVVVIGVAGGGSQTTINLVNVMSSRATVTGSTLRARPDDEKAVLASLVQRDVIPAVASGDLRVPIAREFALDEARDAYDYFAQSGKTGKVVLTVA